MNRNIPLKIIQGNRFLLLLLPAFIFFLWNSDFINEKAFTFSVLRETGFWKKFQEKLSPSLNSWSDISFTLSSDRDLVVVDSVRKIIYQQGNKFLFNGDGLYNLTTPTFIQTHQGVFICYPLTNIRSPLGQGYGISCIYYNFKDENNYFVDGPAAKFKYLGEFKISLIPSASSIQISQPNFSNSCYVSFRNPFKGKEAVLVILSLLFLGGIFIIFQAVLGKLNIQNKKSFRNILIWILLFINHIIFYSFKEKGIGFGDKYIFLCSSVNISYYELLIHFLVLNFYGFLCLRQKQTSAENLKENIFSFFNYLTSLIILILAFTILVNNYEFIRHLSYYSSGRLIFLNLLLIILLIIGLLLFSINIYSGLDAVGLLKSFVLTIILHALIFYLFDNKILIITSLVILLSLIVLAFLLKRRFNATRSPNIFPILLFLTIVLSFVVSLIIFYSLQSQERHRRFLLLSRLESIESGDPILTNEFVDIAQRIKRDSLLINAYHHGKIRFADSLIIHKYFQEDWRFFSVSLTFCTHRDKIRISPSMTEYSCYEYFRNIAALDKEAFDSDYFFVPIEQGNNVKGYLGFIRLNLSKSEDKQEGVFLEFSFTNFSPSFCFADIFYNKGIWNATETIGYSFARYYKGQLISFSGPIWFPEDYKALYDFSLPLGEFTKNQSQYTYLYNNESSSLLLLARTENRFVKFIALFSVITFTVLVILSLFYLLFLYNYRKIRELLVFLRVRLQMGVLGIVIMVLFIMSLILNDFYVSSLIQWTQRDIKDKIHSLSLEIDSRLQESDNIIKDNYLLTQWLYKLSNIYFLDLIYYNIDGLMIVTTIPQVMDKQYFNGRLQQNAYEKIIREKLPFYLQEEKLGQLSYFAVYFPVKKNNNIYGILCSPIVAGRPELDNEYRYYTSMMAGLILLLLFFSVGFALLLSGLVVKPLKTLSENISRLKIGMRNEKIEVKRQDEIGQLSLLYNQLVDALESAIIELRRKERELAWKDVARQIAHEIKNPLTPIKLQLQFLESSYNPLDKEWERRFRTFADTLFEKIDELTRLANTFSELAQWPASNPQLNDIVDLVRRNAYLAFTGFKGKLNMELPKEAVFIKFDKYQIGRVIENLLKNARQAISDESMGIVNIRVNCQPHDIIIEIQDNGSGIKSEQKERIFMPNFTTKSSGMGLGLFISRNIVLSHGGEINFVSVPGKGTIFTVRLPRA